MKNCFRLVKDKDYFVLTTNVDHCFQKAGFDKHRLFYTQGDYGLFQCSEPCCAETFDNGEIIQNMVTAQGYTIAPDGTLTAPEAPKMAVPTELVPHCPHCGRPLTTNLRCDDRFVQDEGWYAAAERYENFLRTRAGQRILFLELGVGHNTPGIIKYPFWHMTDGNPRAVYACLNAGDACAPDAIKNRSVCIDGALADILAQYLKKTRRTSSVFFIVHITAPRSDSGACRDSFFRIQSPMWDSSRCRPCSGCRPCPRRVCRPAG